MIKEAVLPLNVSLVRPIQTVPPNLRKDIDLTERLQNLATRLVKGLWHFPYERRLEILGLPSLVHPRLRTDLILAYNILHGRVNLPINEFFATPVNPNLRGHRFKLRHQLYHLARRKFAFPVRIVEPRNKSPPEVVDSASEKIFKLRLNGVWDTMFVP